MGTRWCWIGFFHLNLQPWNKTRRFPKIYPSEFDLARKLCSRSPTGKRTFQLKKRVPECHAEFTTERSPGHEKNQRIAMFFCRTIKRKKNISSRLMQRLGDGYEWINVSMNLPHRLEKNVKIIVPFIHIRVRGYIRREKDRCN